VTHRDSAVSIYSAAESSSNNVPIALRWPWRPAALTARRESGLRWCSVAPASR